MTRFEPLHPASRTIALGDVHLPYLEHGDADGIPVVLLHGFSDSCRSFERLLPRLPRDVHAFALTQRGHGDAARPASGYATPDFVCDIAGFMDALGLERAVIVGHSMGATHAMAFAATHPQRVLGLVLEAAFADLGANPQVVEFWDQGVSQLVDPIEPAFAREFQVSTLAHPLPEEELEVYVQESLKLPAPVWREVFRGLLDSRRFFSPDSVRAPTLLLWGDRDVFVGQSEQWALCAAIRQARLVVYPGHGHALHWEQPARFAADVVAFARGLAQGGRS